MADKHLSRLSGDEKAALLKPSRRVALTLT
jgi:hypothetical protein